MELNKIENLLEKYDNAETTLAEEAQLQKYFLNEQVAPHLEDYKVLFSYFKQEQQTQYTKDVPLKPRKTIKLYQWISVAAVVVLMLTFSVPNWNSSPKTLADYSPEEQQMYLEAKQALALLSNNFNEGANSLGVLNLASEKFEVGLQKAQHLNQFGTTANSLLRN